MLSTEAIGESDAKGMKIAMCFERKKRRIADPSPSRRAVGYDIVSKSGKEVRYIEVKTRFGSFPVALTLNQHAIAEEKGNEYYLYVVTGEGKICIVQNPVRKCKVVPVPSVDYRIDNWKEKGKHVNFR